MTHTKHRLNRAQADAQAASDEMNANPWFCPLIRGECNRQCISFRPARLEEVYRPRRGDTVYTVHPAYCANSQINPL